jgi:AcrR family transcriptional regulator
MFFDPSDYLAGDLADAESERQEKQLRRDAEQRAKLCEAMTQVAAESGFEATKIYLAARMAGLGLSTYYKLYETREACLLEAFERCAETVLAQVESAMSHPSRPEEKAAAGIGALTELLASEPNVARLMLVEIRVGGAVCREAQLRWLGQVESMVETLLPAPWNRQAGIGRLIVGGLSTIIALEVEAGRAEALPGMAAELVHAGSMGCPDQHSPVALGRH